MKAAWLNDLHLDWLDAEQSDAFLADLSRVEADCFLIAGDIAHARLLAGILTKMEAVLRRDIYFTLGNHDYYHSSLARVRDRIRELCAQSKRLHWMNTAGIVRLTAATALVGHDGWGDGRLGDPGGTGVELADFLLIRELRGLGRKRRLERLNALGDEAAAHVAAFLPGALASADHVVVLTHVPPFAEAIRHEGRPRGD